MLGSVRRMMGVVKVEENAGVIHVSGVPTDTMARAISKMWSTTKINAWMFNKITGSTFSFNSFFAPDVVFMLNELCRGSVSWGVRNSLEKVIHGIETETWYRSTTVDTPFGVNYGALNHLNVKLLPHQKEFINIYDQNVRRYGLNGYILAAAPGSGKTINGLAWAEVLEADLTICISPKIAVEDVWEKTITGLYKTPQPYWSSLSKRPYAGEKKVVIHYEFIPKFLEMIQQSKGGVGRVAIILDESHNMNEIDALRTQKLVELVHTYQDCQIIWASGTPFKALGFECVPILRTIDKLFTADTEMRFRRIFGKNAKRGLEIIANRIGLISFKVAKQAIQTLKPIETNHQIRVPDSDKFTLPEVSKVMSDYIQKRREFYAANIAKYREDFWTCLRMHEATLSGDDARADFRRYKSYVEEIAAGFDPTLHADMAKYCNKYEKTKIIPSLPAQWRQAFKEAKTVVKYVELKIMGEALGNILGKLRTECHLAMLPHMNLPGMIRNAQKKTLIFTSFVEVTEAADTLLRHEGFKPLIVNGSTSKDIAKIVERFFNDPDANPMIATFQSLSTAVPLIAANEIVFTNQPFRDYILQQAKARVDRIGQDTQTYFRNTFLDTGKVGNISTRANDILEWSRKQVEILMGEDVPVTNDMILNKFATGLESLGTEFSEIVYNKSLESLEENVHGAEEEEEHWESVRDKD